MAILSVIGEQGATKQGDNRQWSYMQGEAFNEVHKGVYANMKALYDTYKALGSIAPDIDQLNLVYERGMGTLTVSTVSDAPAQYELVSNQQSLPITAHPYFVDDATVLTAQEIHAVQTAFELGIDKNPSTGAAYPFDGSAFDTGRSDTKQATLYGFLARGVETFDQCAYVLRSVQIVSKRSIVKAAYTNVNKVETPPDTTAVNTLIGTLPSGEWLKQGPQVRMYGAKKWQISQEWWWAPKWSSVLHGGTGTP